MIEQPESAVLSVSLETCLLANLNHLNVSKFIHAGAVHWQPPYFASNVYPVSNNGKWHNIELFHRDRKYTKSVTNAETF